MTQFFIRAPANRIPQVDESRCAYCQKCLARRACKSKALIQLDPSEPPMVDAARCFGCQACAGACPFGAITPPR